MPLNLTIAIPTKNEQTNLAGCLEAIGSDLAKQIIVIDSGSTDRTLEIARDFGAEVINFEWNGKFPKKRNWFLRNYTPQSDWILFLDSDEYLTVDFKNELQQKIEDTTLCGFQVTFKNFFMGKQLKYGDPFKKLPLFRVGKGEYERIEEDHWSHLDMEIHEHPIINGKVGAIRAPIIHNDYKNLEKYISRHNEYSSWEAQRFLDLRRKGFQNLTNRQIFKYWLMRFGLLPVVYFFGSYFFKLGFLDGREGFYFHLYKAHYFLQIQTKIKEVSNGNTPTQNFSHVPRKLMPEASKIKNFFF